MSRRLSAREAYAVMLRFLDDYYRRGPSDELGSLLGSLAASDDGHPMDPAAWEDWLKAFREVIGEASEEGQ